MSINPDEPALETELFSELECARALMAIRWPNGFSCPSCGPSAAYLIQTRRLPLLECRNCKLQTSVTAGTILEKSRTPLYKWFKAFYLLSQPDGISAVQLSIQLQVTYKTAWLIAHKIRFAMGNAEQSELLQGAVRVSFASYGYPEFCDAKVPVIVGASVNRNDEPVHLKIMQPSPEHIIMRSIRAVTDAGLCAFANRYLDPLASDPEPDYPRKRKLALTRQVWSANDWMNQTFHGIGTKHLQAYFDEYCFRTNARWRKYDAFEAVIQWSMNTAKLTYAQLTKRRSILALPWKNTTKNKWKGVHLSLLEA